LAVQKNIICNSEPEIITIPDFDCDNFDPEITLENIKNASLKVGLFSLNDSFLLPLEIPLCEAPSSV